MSLFSLPFSEDLLLLNSVSPIALKVAFELGALQNSTMRGFKSQRNPLKLNRLDGRATIISGSLLWRYKLHKQNQTHQEKIGSVM